ncbi:MAG: ATP synthase F1 subunit delta [Myxococcota bacterium]
MSHAVVANRYGRAIFDLGVETNTLPELVEKIGRFARVYAESAELRSVLDNPLVEIEKREAILRDVAQAVGLSGTGLNAIRLLAARHKLAALPDIAKRLGSLSDEKAGIVRASVTTAVRMPEGFYERLRGELEAATARRIVIERSEDPSLIGGVITRIGDNTIDGSVRGHLAEIERSLRSS